MQKFHTAKANQPDALQLQSKVYGVIMKSLKYLLCLLCAVFLLVNPAEAKKITFLTHFIKPFTHQENGEVTGFAVDIVREMMKLQEYPEEFEIYPFKRGLRTVQNTPDHALFIVARRAEREETVKWVGPLITSGVYFYKKKGTPLEISYLEEIKEKYSVVVQRGNADHYFLKEKGFTDLSITNNQKLSLQMVDKGRVDLTPISELVMPEIAKEAGIDLNNIERTNVKLYDSTLYLAFSKNIPDKTVAEWQQALDSLKSSGKYQELYSKYLLPDKASPQDALLNKAIQDELPAED